MEVNPCPVCGAMAGHNPGCPAEARKSLEELMQAMSAAAEGGKLSREQRREMIGEIFTAVKERLEALGASYYERPEDAYRALRGKEWIVRRESTERLMDTVSGADMEMKFDASVAEEYANAVVWDYDRGTRGLRNAFLEGWSSLGGLVTVAIYDKGKDVTVKDIEGNMKRIGDLERETVRIVKGTIHPQDVKAIVVAAPAGFFPEDLMTEDERDRLDESLDAQGKIMDPKSAAWPVFRAFVFDREAGKAAAA